MGVVFDEVISRVQAPTPPPAEVEAAPPAPSPVAERRRWQRQFDDWQRRCLRRQAD